MAQPNDGESHERVPKRRHDLLSLDYGVASPSTADNPSSIRGNGDEDASRTTSKRRKVDRGARHIRPRELAPRSVEEVSKLAVTEPSQLAYAKSKPTPKLKPASSYQRVTSINLKTYPSNHHPVGIGVWISQKIEQARRELENQTPAGQSRDSPSVESENEEYDRRRLSQIHEIAPANAFSSSNAEAERLQAQRKRKMKQRQDNWAKNKETDVVARAKIESKKHFDALPNATDAEQQEWIEEKIKLDFGRLLDRLAAQLNSEIVGMPLYQIGFADYFFNKLNPLMAAFDDEVINAARLIGRVLPALSESVFNSRHQQATNALIHALVNGVPSQQAFNGAIFMLARDPQVLSGLDKVLGIIFAPKTGSQLSQLARKRAIKDSDQLGSGNGLHALSSPVTNAPIWHWKEPATIANSLRHAYPPKPAAQGREFNVVVQPYHQDPLPPPVAVQAAVYRPPLPPFGRYRPTYQSNWSQGYHQNSPYQGPPPNLVPSGTFMNPFDQNGQMRGTWPTPPPFGAHIASYQKPMNGYTASNQQPMYQPAPQHSTENYQLSNHRLPSIPHLNGQQSSSFHPPPNIGTQGYQIPPEAPAPSSRQSVDQFSATTSSKYQQTLPAQADQPSDLATESSERLPGEFEDSSHSNCESPSPAISPQRNGTTSNSLGGSKARLTSAIKPALILQNPMETRKQSSAGQPPSSSQISRKEPVSGANDLSADLENTTNSHTSGESLRRRSTRGTILTPKAKAAGILLGKQSNNVHSTDTSRATKSSPARNASTSPEANGPLRIADDNETAEAGIDPVVKLSAATNDTNITSQEPQIDTAEGDTITPRSSGRERKPTAKVLASSVQKSGAKAPDYSNSIPRVASKLRLYHSSQVFPLSETSIEPKTTSGEQSSSPVSTSTSPAPIEVDDVGPLDNNSTLSKIRARSKALKNVTIPRIRISPSKEKDLHSIINIDQHLKAAAVSASPTKRQRFLKNDREQTMSEALLMMARVAADWSDSEEMDETDGEAGFQSKLQEALDKQTQQSRLSARTEPSSREEVQQVVSTTYQPVTGRVPKKSPKVRKQPSSSYSLRPSLGASKGITTY